MIRRDVLSRDNRSVKWALLAATFALSIGFWAQHTLEVTEEEDTAAVVQEAAPVIEPETIAG